jgi:hypothetical protein
LGCFRLRSVMGDLLWTSRCSFKLFILRCMAAIEE